MMASSAFQSVKPAEVGDEQYCKNLITVYMPVICDKLSVNQVISHLATSGGIFANIADIGDAWEQASKDRKTGVVMLMKKLSKSTDPQWFQKFIDALKKSGQQIIFKLLNEDESPNEEIFESVLMMNLAVVIETINPEELVPFLVEKGTITSVDKEEILSETVRFKGAQKLVTRLPCRKNGWFTDFIAALKRCKYDILLKEIDPKFLEARSDHSILHVATEYWHSRNKRDFRQPKMDKVTEEESLEKQRVTPNFSVGEAKSQGTSNVSVGKGKSRNTSDVSAGKVKSRTTSSDVSAGKNKSRNISDVSSGKVTPSTAALPSKSSNPSVSSVKEDQQNKDEYSTYDEDYLVSLHADHELPDLNKVDENHEASLCVKNDGSAMSSKSGSRKKHNANSTNDISIDGSTSSAKCNTNQNSHSDAKRGDAYCMSDLNLRSCETSIRASVENTMNDLSNVTSERSSATTGGIMDSSANITRSTPSEEDSDENIEKEKLELRGYQRELAEKGYEGKNCIIVAPTGSGKTHVAIAISKHHLGAEPEDDRKILFIVPKVALVKQQRNNYQKYMEDDCKVTSVSGEQNMQMSLLELIRNNDVIVLTPQILVNAIDDGVVDESFCGVTLMIFDECHHAMKEHPYNNIMSKYNDILLSGNQEKIQRLPQVVGLTASPGVGKAKNDEAAVDHILKLCANLAADDICTITQRQNLYELQRYVNTPVEGIEEVKGRENDQFETTVSQIMAEIEARLRSQTDISKLTLEVPNIEKLLEPPTRRDHDAYTQYLANLRKEIAKIYSQETRRLFLCCQEHLDCYHNALMINADCRTIEAFEYIKTRFQEMNSATRSLPNNETELWLNRLYSRKTESLERISRSPHSENPKLKYLEELILGYYREKKDSQGIIFCKTRFMTDALVKWMNGTQSLQFLNPHILVGAGSTAAKTNVSMTRNKLDDVLKYFKEGKHKIIVATAVAEEGLDVKSCNYVIRYEHVTNDIARVQARGRARAVDAKYVLVGDQRRGVAHREVVNQVREEMMTRAIYLVNRVPHDEFQSRINDYQIAAKHERDMSAAAKAANREWKASHSHEGDYELRCFKCDALGICHSDLRTVRGQHHIVLDPDFKERITCEDHPRPRKFDEFQKTGKLYCKKCGWDWGISAQYKSVPVYMLKVCSFVVQDYDQGRQTYKRWKEVPFEVTELAPEDLKTLTSVFTGV